MIIAAEAHTNYYDGFVRNCHSTYKNVLKTVAFSIKMGQQLSHKGNKAVRYEMDRQNKLLCEWFLFQSPFVQWVALNFDSPYLYSLTP